MTDNLLELITKTLDDKKAEHISVLDFRSISADYDYFVLADADNPRLAASLSDYVVEAALLAGYTLHHIEESADADWILIDLHDVIVHIFLREGRSHYNLDKLWQDRLVHA